MVEADGRSNFLTGDTRRSGILLHPTSLPGSGGITKVHGTWHQWHGLRVLPLFHPAYLLRNASRERGAPKWLMWQDMKLLTAALDELPPKQAKLVIDTAEQGALF